MKCSKMSGSALLLRFKEPSGKEIHPNLENSNCDPVNYTMGSPMLIVSICKGNIFSEYKRINWIIHVHKLVEEAGLTLAQNLL